MGIISYLCHKFITMLKLDFSDFNKNGFRINQFRIFYSPDMRGQNFTTIKEKMKISEDLIGERDVVMKYLIERNEINFSIFFFSTRILVFLIIIGLVTLILPNVGFIVKFLPILLAVVFYFLSLRFKESFILGNVGIQIAESIYGSKIADKYNF